VMEISSSADFPKNIQATAGPKIKLWLTLVPSENFPRVLRAWSPPLGKDSDWLNLSSVPSRSSCSQQE
jgi:hypothetical protein